MRFIATLFLPRFHWGVLQLAALYRRTAETTAAGRLYLDHLCAEVSQMTTQRIRGEQSHLENSDILEKFHNATFPDRSADAPRRGTSSNVRCGYIMVIDFNSVYSSKPQRPCSRPRPLCLKPPKGPRR